MIDTCDLVGRSRCIPLVDSLTMILWVVDSVHVIEAYYREEDCHSLWKGRFVISVPWSLGGGLDPNYAMD